jgi:transcription elongation factor SPT6
MQGARYIKRKINHTKFLNVGYSNAVTTLTSKEDGEYVFRPSSKGINNITLTWKFFNTCFVNLDIQEQEKPAGAVIG